MQLHDHEQNTIEVIEGVRLPSCTSLDCDISFPDGHWIPNTSDTVRLNNIEIWGKDTNGNKVVITDDYQDVKFLDPLDPNWRVINDEANNSYTNKGACTCELCVEINNEIQPIIKFGMKAVPTSGEAFEVSEYCTPYFNGEGIVDENNQYYSG